VNNVLEWVEKAALENMRGHAQAADTLAKEAATTLTILLAILSGAFAFSLRTSDYQYGAISMTAYLFLLCVLLVIKCLVIREFPAVTNEPKNLYQEGYDLDALRKAELRNMQERINLAAGRNTVTAQWLNRVRIGTIFSPLVFVSAIYAWGLAHHGAQVVAAG
jgi:hypothetical protein